jgi:hypothetical protein
MTRSMTWSREEEKRKKIAIRAHQGLGAKTGSSLRQCGQLCKVPSAAPDFARSCFHLVILIIRFPALGAQFPPIFYQFEERPEPSVGLLDEFASTEKEPEAWHRISSGLRLGRLSRRDGGSSWPGPLPGPLPGLLTAPQRRVSYLFSTSTMYNIRPSSAGLPDSIYYFARGL